MPAYFWTLANSRNLNQSNTQIIDNENVGLHKIDKSCCNLKLLTACNRQQYVLLAR